MKNVQQENIFTTSEHFLTLLKFSGLFPMSFNGPTRDGNFKIKATNVIVSLLSLSTLVTCFIVNLINGEADHGVSTVQLQSWSFAVKFEFYCHILLFIYQIYNREKIVKFLKQIDRADKEVIFVYYD